MTCEDVWHIKLRSAVVLRSQGRASDQKLVVTHVFKISFLVLFPVTSCFPFFVCPFPWLRYSLCWLCRSSLSSCHHCFLSVKDCIFHSSANDFLHLHLAVELFNTHSCFQITSECVLALSCWSKKALPQRTFPNNRICWIKSWSDHRTTFAPQLLFRSNTSLTLKRACTLLFE